MSDRTSSPTLNLSVILCTYNHCEQVQATLASLRHQTLPYERYEVIVVDNGSVDGTFGTLRSLARRETEQDSGSRQAWRVRCLQELRNGLAYARHKGLQAASGDIIIFLDDDTLVAPTALECLLEAYEQTGADALGPRVELYWEAGRPHWLSDDLCHLLGYFAPGGIRTQLPDPFSFSNSCFSARAAVLHRIGLSSPLLSQRFHTPAHMESAGLCRRLHRNGYTLWYEPAALVIHRISAARLQRSFFRGLAYRQGRADMLAQYTEEEELRIASPLTLVSVLNIVRPELHNIIRSFLFDRLLLSLTDQSSNKQLLAEMEYAYNWGRLSQLWRLIERPPIDAVIPSVLLVHEEEHSSLLLQQGLQEHAVHCTTSTGLIPFAWLLRHRADLGQSIAIIHIYQPGALNMTWWQRQYFSFKLWLARRLGIRIVVTDAGGWWQHIRSLRFHARYGFEQILFKQSDLLLTHARHSSQLYAASQFFRRACYLDHPGMHGYYPQFPTRAQAYAALGLPPLTGFVYLCLAYLHDEREIQFLIEAFVEAYWYLKGQTSEKPSPLTNPQLLVLGQPRDKQYAIQLLQRAALNPAIHLFRQADEHNTALGMGAAHALVFPHRAVYNAGTPAIAMLGYCYERTIIAPDLPHFRAMLPSYATVSFTPGSHPSLVQALLKARLNRYQLSEQEKQDLEVRRSWQAYAHRLLALYQELVYNHQA